MVTISLQKSRCLPSSLRRSSYSWEVRLIAIWGTRDLVSFVCSVGHLFIGAHSSSASIIRSVKSFAMVSTSSVSPSLSHSFFARHSFYFSFVKYSINLSNISQKFWCGRIARMLAFLLSNNSSFSPHPCTTVLDTYCRQVLFFRALNQTKKCGKIFFVFKREIVCRQSFFFFFFLLFFFFGPL